MKCHSSTSRSTLLKSAINCYQQFKMFDSNNFTLSSMFSFQNGLFQKKSTPPRRKACWKISREGGLTALEIQT